MLDPDHDGKQAKYEASQDNVVDFVKEKTVRTFKKNKAIKLSKVYARGKLKPDGTSEWAFNVRVGNNVTGYSFETRKDAIKGRLLFQKKIKSEGYLIHCQS